MTSLLLALAVSASGLLLSERIDPLSAVALEAPGTPFSDIPDSRSLSSPVLVEGAVSTLRGKPAGGARVRLSMWPSQDEIEQMQEGDSLTLVPLGHTVVGSDGRFEIRLNEKALAKARLSGTGLVDLELTVTGDHVMTAHALTVTLKPDVPGALGRGEGPWVPERGLELRLDTEIPSHAVAAEAGVDQAGGRVSDARYRLVGHNDPCPGGAGLKQEYSPSWTKMGVSHVNGSNKWQKLTTTSGTTSELGSATSASGAKGTWSASGKLDYKLTETQAASVNFGRHSDQTSLALFTSYRYGKFCITSWDTMHTTHYYRARVYRFAGGVDFRAVNMPSTQQYCRPYPPGTGGANASSKAKQWTQGVKIGGVLGIDLSSQTGYTNSTTIKWHFKDTGPGGRACGTADYPGGTPRKVILRRP